MRPNLFFFTERRMAEGKQEEKKQVCEGMIASSSQIYYTNLSKQRKLGLKFHISDKFDRPGRRLIDWRIDLLLAAGLETKNISQAPPLQFALQKTKETTRTLCRGNFP
ncbi:hypothetical protein QT976_20505 [Microcoleus sp. w2-18aC6]|uniref:hypothetical protein n=1 Tax=unclassified Microcoleus TaxID=2642155 RepID=UPI002FD054AA